MHDNKVLTSRAVNDDFWALPGGHVEFLESSPETLVREIKEELGVDARVERLLCVGESFFDYQGKHYHELGLYHLVSLGEQCPLYEEHEFRGVDEETDLIFRWCPLAELDEVTLYPTFLKEVLKGLGEANGVQHFVRRGE